MPDYATTSFWFNWAMFVAALIYLLVTHRPFDWVAIRQSLALAVFFLIFGLGVGAVFGSGDLQTMLLLKNGRMEEVCVAAGYACLAYAILVLPWVLAKQVIVAVKQRRDRASAAEQAS